MKTCSSCKVPKPLSEFGPMKRNKDGLAGRCRDCVNKKHQTYRDSYKQEHDGEPEGRRYDQSHGEDYAKAAARKYQERKDFVNAIKEASPCMDCHQFFPAVCMDFDHRPGEVKKMGIAKMVINLYSLPAILEEIKKCDLVCANCHRIRTWILREPLGYGPKYRKYDRSTW